MSIFIEATARFRSNSPDDPLSEHPTRLIGNTYCPPNNSLPTNTKIKSPSQTDRATEAIDRKTVHYRILEVFADWLSESVDVETQRAVMRLLVLVLSLVLEMRGCIGDMSI